MTNLNVLKKRYPTPYLKTIDELNKMKGFIAILSVAMLCAFLCLILFASSKSAYALRKTRSTSSQRNVPERFSLRKPLQNSTDSCTSASKKKTPQLTGLNILESIGPSKMNQKFINGFINAKKLYPDIRQYISSESRYIKLHYRYPVTAFGINLPSLECMKQSKIPSLIAGISIFQRDLREHEGMQISDIKRNEIWHYFNLLKTFALYFNDLIEESGPSSLNWSWDKTKCRLDYTAFISISYSQDSQYSIAFYWRKNNRANFPFLSPAASSIVESFRNTNIRRSEGKALNTHTLRPFDRYIDELQLESKKYSKLPKKSKPFKPSNYFHLINENRQRFNNDLASSKGILLNSRNEHVENFENCFINRHNFDPFMGICIRKYHQYPSSSSRYQYESLRNDVFVTEVSDIFKSESTVSFEEHMKKNSKTVHLSSFLELKNSANVTETFDEQDIHDAFNVAHYPYSHSKSELRRNKNLLTINSYPYLSLRLANNEFNEKIKTANDPIMIEQQEEFNEFLRELEDLCEFGEKLKNYPNY